jgi:hypothetical protein
MLFLALILLQESPEIPLSHRNGPRLNDSAHFTELAPYEIIQAMFAAMKTLWLKPAYMGANQVNLRGNLEAVLPPRNPQAGQQAMNFDTQLAGDYRTDGSYHYDFKGSLGEGTLLRSPTKSMTISHTIRAFADQPQYARPSGARYSNFHSWLLGLLGPMEQQILESGVYRYVYGGSGNFEGRLVHVVRIYKPQKPGAASRGPMPLKRLWTFWHDGGYEVWIYADNYLPAAFFYTNGPDLIHASVSFHYHKPTLPHAISFQNNSTGFEGKGEFELAYDAEGLLESVDFQFSGDRGQRIQLECSLSYSKENEALKALPPFGYQKVNADHLRLLLTTQMTGSLLQLRKYGLNIKNFKF